MYSRIYDSSVSSWRFQPTWKISVKMGIFPQVGVKIKLFETAIQVYLYIFVPDLMHVHVVYPWNSKKSWNPVQEGGKNLFHIINHLTIHSLEKYSGLICWITNCQIHHDYIKSRAHSLYHIDTCLQSIQCSKHSIKNYRPLWTRQRTKSKLSKPKTIDLMGILMSWLMK